MVNVSVAVVKIALKISDILQRNSGEVCLKCVYFLKMTGLFYRM